MIVLEKKNNLDNNVISKRTSLTNISKSKAY